MNDSIACDHCGMSEGALRTCEECGYTYCLECYANRDVHECADLDDNE